MTIFASFIKQNGADPVLKLPCVLARSLLSLFSVGGLDSPAKGLLPLCPGSSQEAFPTLPERSQFNDACAFYAEDTEVAVKLGQIMEGGEHPYHQALDASAMPIRDVKRRGHGWLARPPLRSLVQPSVGVEAFSLLISVERSGVITGFVAPASTADQSMAETFFAVRAYLNPRVPCVGSLSLAPYVADKGFEEPKTIGAGLKNTQQAHPSSQTQLWQTWSKQLRKWIAGIRQVVESVYDKLFNIFGLWRERPHDPRVSRWARLASRVALHNFCIWLNDQLGRPRLSFADLMGW